MLAGMSGVRVRGVSKRYARSGPYVLRAVDVAVSPGDIVHVRGGNGSGKSTLLRIIAGVSSPSSGRVLGRPRGVGFVPERFPPAVRFTARDYLHHLAAIRRTQAAQAIDLLDRLGAAGYLHRPMTELSKGTCQKVALSQALCGPPGLLVLDEAWTGLDTEAQAVLTSEARSYAAAGGIVVLTDHARRTSDVRPGRHWRVSQGHLTETGAPRLTDATRVVLAAPAGRRSTLEVEPTACDALLHAALTAGWSVVEVRP
jgi:ABC-type multidrug transport system ATPase subunit